MRHMSADSRGLEMQAACVRSDGLVVSEPTVDRRVATGQSSALSVEGNPRCASWPSLRCGAERRSRITGIR
jgi:hypothetical protein